MDKMTFQDEEMAKLSVKMTQNSHWHINWI